jgi:hypothetical protein
LILEVENRREEGLAALKNVLESMMTGGIA